MEVYTFVRLCLFVAKIIITMQMKVLILIVFASLQTQAPYPTPRYDPSSYIPAVRPGKTVTVRGANLADRIQAAQADPSVGTVRIEGGGSIAKQVTLRKHTVFDSSTYSCDVQGIAVRFSSVNRKMVKVRLDR